MTAAPTVEQSFDYCRRICRTHARNFYYGLKLSPEPQRSALFAIYAWMRLADDLVDAKQPVPREIAQRIAEYREATDSALKQQPMHNTPLWVALAETARRFNLSSEHFHSMLDGQIDDLEQREYRTFDDLKTYCYRVASSVGLLCIEIWGYEDKRARDLAIDRGIAFQLTNILRDFKEDFDGGRVYLPQLEFEHVGLTPSNVRSWSDPDQCAAFMNDQIQRAESYYDRSAALDEMIAPACRPTLWAMTAIYRELLETMRRNPARIVVGPRIRLSAWRKGTIAFRAKWQASSPIALVRGSTTKVSGVSESASV